MLTDVSEILNRFKEESNYDLILNDLYDYIDGLKNPILEFYNNRNTIIEVLVALGDMASYRDISSSSKNTFICRLEDFISKVTEIFEYLDVIGYMDSENRIRPFRKEKLRVTTDLFLKTLKDMLSSKGTIFNRHPIMVLDGELDNFMVRNGIYRKLEILSSSTIYDRELLSKYKTIFEESFNNAENLNFTHNYQDIKRRLLNLNTNLNPYSYIDKSRANPSSNISKAIFKINCGAKQAFEDTCKELKIHKNRTLINIYLEIQDKMFKVENLGKALIAIDGIIKIRAAKLREENNNTQSIASVLRGTIANFCIFLSSNFGDSLAFLLQ